MSDERSPSPGPDAGSGDASREATAPVPVNNWNLPNALTTLRIVLVPLFGWLLLVDDGQDATYRVWAFVVFTLAILTDRIDGEIARARNLVTDFGKLMDPIADKALTGMAFIGLSIIGELWWWVTIVVLAREWGITLMRFWIIKYGVMPASRGGKIKTTLQAVALCGADPPAARPRGQLLGAVRRPALVGIGRRDGRGGRGHGGHRLRLRPRGDQAAARGPGRRARCLRVRRTR